MPYYHVSGGSASVSSLGSMRKHDSGNASTGGGPVAPTQWSQTAYPQLSSEPMNNGPSVRGHPTGLCLARKGRGYSGGGGDIGAQRPLEGGQGSPHPGKHSAQGHILLFLPPPNLSFPICSYVQQTHSCMQRRCAHARAPWCSAWLVARAWK